MVRGGSSAWSSAGRLPVYGRSGSPHERNARTSGCDAPASNAFAACSPESPAQRRHARLAAPWHGFLRGPRRDAGRRPTSVDSERPPARRRRRDSCATLFRRCEAGTTHVNRPPGSRRSAVTTAASPTRSRRERSERASNVLRRAVLHRATEAKRSFAPLLDADTHQASLSGRQSLRMCAGKPMRNRNASPKSNIQGDRHA